MDIFSIFDTPKPHNEEKPRSEIEILLTEVKGIALNNGVSVADVLLAKLILTLEKTTKC